MKQIARGSTLSVAKHTLKDPVMRKTVVKGIGQMIRRELSALCIRAVPSVLSTGVLESFTWNNLIEELHKDAPVLLEILRVATKSTRHRSFNQNAIIGICSSILCRHRSARMSLIQKVISLILYAGHANKQVSTTTCTLCFINL